MAHNLAKAGFEVVGFDTQDVKVDLIKIVSNAKDCVLNSDVVITMLPNGEILKTVATQIIEHMKNEAIFLDCSTVDVASAKSVAELSENYRIIPLDAPVSGGIGGATAGTLTFMVGGPLEGFNKVKNLFDIMGQKAVHCGNSGSGQSAKICNNMILGTTMIALAESFTMAKKLGLDQKTFFDISSKATGMSWAMLNHLPVANIIETASANNNFKPGFAAEMMLKDLSLAQAAANSINLSTPIGSLALSMYKEFISKGNGSLDYSAIIKLIDN